MPQKFNIEIHRWGMMIGADKITIVTQDSIIVHTISLVDKSGEYRKALNTSEKQKIAEAFSKIDLDNLKDDYTDNNASDDLDEYDFKITMGKKIKAFHIYRVKVDEVFNLVQAINSTLPKEQQIGYNDEYFNY
jgi:hypothetical protein